MSDELGNELEMAMNDLLLLGARLEWSSSGAESLEIQAEIDDTKSVIAASLRARPQEPGDLISRAIEFIESDHDLDTRNEVLAKLLTILEKYSGAAPVLGGDK